MGFLLFPIIIYGTAILFYSLAHMMPNKKWLAAYSLFWSTILVFAIYDTVKVANISGKDGDFSLGWVLVIGFIFLVSIASITGVISRSIVLYLIHQGKQINLAIVHLFSFLSIQFISPLLIGLATFIIASIIELM